MISRNSSPQSTLPAAQNALRLILVLLGAALVVDVTYFWLAQQLQAWQIFSAAVLVLVFCLITALSALLVWRGRPTLGAWLIFISMMIIWPLSTLLVAGLGLVLGLSFLIIITPIASQALSPRQASLATTLAFVGGAITLLVDLYGPASRLAVPAFLQSFIPTMTAIITVVYAVIFIRQFRNLSLRLKLTFAFLIVALVPVGILGYSNYQTARENVLVNADRVLLSDAAQTARAVDDFIEKGLNNVRSQAGYINFIEFLKLPADQRARSPEENRMRLTIRAIATEDKNIISVAILDAQGQIVFDNLRGNIGADEADTLHFSEALRTKLPYFSPLQISYTIDEPVLYFAAPIRDGQDIIGVYRVQYLADVLQELVLANSDVMGQQTSAILLDENNLRLADAAQPELILKSVTPLSLQSAVDLQAVRRLPAGEPEDFATLLPSFAEGLATADTQPTFTAFAYPSADAGRVAVAKLENAPWRVAYVQPSAVFLAPLETQTRTTLFVAVLIAALAALVAVPVAQALSQPIARLTAVASQLAEGDLTVRAPVNSRDEIGMLATTFNQMTSQLRGTLANMEEQVTARTRDLELAVDVGRSVSRVRNLNDLLNEAVELIRERFNLYYAQVYLLDDARRRLILRAGTGEAGAELLRRQHALLVGLDSLNGRAASTRLPVLVADTASAPDFKPNPLLPETRSEAVIPLMIGDRVLGVLDLQSAEPGIFTHENLAAYQTLASLLTVAVENARLFAETEKSRTEVEVQARRLVGQGWQEFLDAIHIKERFAHLYTAPELDEVEAAPEIPNTLSLPIKLAGQTVGTLDLERAPDETWTVADQNLVATVAKQVAQQIENLRLLAQGEQYRAEAEEAVRRLTREGWQTYVRDAAQLAEGFGYDGVQVQPATAILLGEAVEQQPLIVRGEQVGEIVIEAEALTPEAEQILAAVSEQLTAHIENLRLSEQTYAALAENERRNATLAALNRVVSAASSARDVSDLLNTAAQEILQALQARNVGVAVFTDGSRSQLKVMADANSSPNDSSAVGVLIPVVGNTSTEYVLTNRHSLVVEKAQTDPRTASIHELMRARSTHSLMIVPLLSRGEIIGTIGVDSDDPNRHFSSEEVSLVETMAGQLAGAIDNLRSFEQTQRRANREAIINDITAKIQGTVTVDSALQTTIQELGKALKARKTRVALGVTSTELETNGHTTPN